ncbi:MAG: hypothetical protein FWE62_03085, partial [Firmicutes bacterium]|nr:hypothetical protein [Bacillota bacterium]
KGSFKVYNSQGTDVTSGTAHRICPFLWKGYYYDYDMGLYWIGDRWYDPDIGQFVSPASPKSIFALAMSPGMMNLHGLGVPNPLMFPPNPHNCFTSLPLVPADSGSSGGGWNWLNRMPNWAKWTIGGVIIAGLIIATPLTGGLSGVVGGMMIGSLTSAAIGFGVGLATGGWNGAANGFFWGSITGAISGGLSAGFSLPAGTAFTWGRFASQGAINAMINFGVSMGESFIINGRWTLRDLAGAGISAVAGFLTGGLGAWIDTSTALSKGWRHFAASAGLGFGLEVGEKVSTFFAVEQNAAAMQNYMLYLLLYGNFI